MLTDTLDRLNILLGSPCLRHLLALPATKSASSRPAVEDLTDKSVAVLNAIVAVMQSLPEGEDSEFLIRLEVVRRLGQFVSQDGCSWATAAHRAAGGSDIGVNSDDPVLRALLPQLRDVYAILLLPAIRPFSSADLGSALYGHPSSAPFEDSVMADQDLGRLFPEVSEMSGRTGSYTGPSRGGGIQLWTLPSQLISTAFDWVRLESAVPSPDDVANKLGHVVECLRRASRGEAIEMPVRVALTGSRLPDTIDSFHIGDVRIRARDHRDDWLVGMTQLDQSLTTGLDDGTQIEISYAGDIILDTSMDYRIELGELTDHWPTGLQTLRQAVDRRIEAIRLGLALASDTDPILVLQSWTMSLDLLSHNPSIGWRDIHLNCRLVPRQLTAADVEEWRVWAERILSVDMSRVDIAQRRVLQALGERQSPDDILIDSVMAWENLFGAEQETTFRVCGSLAWLLADDLENRKSLMKELKQIYGLRSRVVHGAKSLDPADYETTRRALNIALDAFRIILRDRPDLLSEPDGPARSNRVLIGD